MAKNTIADLSTTAASNTDVAGDGIAGTDLVSKGDNVIRGALALLKKWWNDLNGQVTVGGTANAVTITSSSVYQTLVAGIGFRFVATAENTGATTLALDGLTAKAIRKIVGGTDVALAAGDIAVGRRCDVVYDTAANAAAGAWILTNPANVYVSSASLTPASVTSLDNGASAGPVFDYFRDSLSPAVSDFLAQFDLNGRSSTGVKRTYGRIAAQINDPTNAAEYGTLRLYVLTNGSLLNVLTAVANDIAIGTGVVFDVDPVGIGTTGGGPVVLRRALDLTNLNSGQIAFPASQVASADANTLDHYVEGTFTPGLTFGGAAVGLTSSTATGRYVKIGRLVYFEAAMTLTAKGSSSGAALLTGPAFTHISGNTLGLAAVSHAASLTGLTGALTAYVNSGTTGIVLEQSSATGPVSITDANFTNTSTIFVNGSYYASA